MNTYTVTKPDGIEVNIEADSPEEAVLIVSEGDVDLSSETIHHEPGPDICPDCGGPK